MSKKLYLMRHAQADSGFGINDKDRVLTPHGMDQAETIGRCLGKIDTVLCSSARRTKMTLDILQENGAKFNTIEFRDDLYNAGNEGIRAVIESRTEDSLLIITHNPGIHLLAAELAGFGEDILLEKLRLFYNPATLSVFDCPIQSWRNLKDNANTLTDLIIPD